MSIKGDDEKFCESCGEIIKKDAEICPKCGVRVAPVNFAYKTKLTPLQSGNPDAKQRIVYILLGIFLGELGIHNFYAGYTKNGTIQLIITITTGWIFGLGVLITFIWSLIDIINITVDANGNPMI